MTPEESALYCGDLAASHYENFHVITWLTPRHLRSAFAAIYAYCRWSDDLGDEVGDRASSARSFWPGGASELRTVYGGNPRHPVMQALRPVVTEYQIPIDPFLALISAFEQDQEVLEYETYEQLLDYCERSANPVGRLVLYLFRCMNEETGKLSDATCTALQLANFWQDVVPDLENRARIYLPAEDRARFGVTRQDLESRTCSEGFRQLMAFRGRAGAPVVRARASTAEEGAARGGGGCRPVLAWRPGNSAGDRAGGVRCVDREARAGQAD